MSKTLEIARALHGSSRGARFYPIDPSESGGIRYNTPLLLCATQRQEEESRSNGEDSRGIFLVSGIRLKRYPLAKIFPEWRRIF